MLTTRTSASFLTKCIYRKSNSFLVCGSSEWIFYVKLTLMISVPPSCHLQPHATYHTPECEVAYCKFKCEAMYSIINLNVRLFMTILDTSGSILAISMLN